MEQIVRFENHQVVLVFCECGLHAHFSKPSFGQSLEFCSKAGGVEVLRVLYLFGDIGRAQFLSLRKAVELSSLPEYDSEITAEVRRGCALINDRKLATVDELPVSLQ